MKLVEARELIALARAEAERIGAPMSIAVVDSAGHVVALERMDGASFMTPDVAIAKAYTAAAVKLPTEDLAGVLKDHPEVLTSIAVASHGRFMAAMGGFPVAVDGEVVGAIGASGGSGEQDVAVAKAALTGSD
jgi:cob(I)alamin adenosyltransferase